MLLNIPKQFAGKPGSYMFPFGKPIAYATGTEYAFDWGTVATLQLPPGVMKDYVYVIINGVYSAFDSNFFDVRLDIELDTGIPGDDVPVEFRIATCQNSTGYNTFGIESPFTVIMIYTPSATVKSRTQATALNIVATVIGLSTIDWITIKAMAFVA